jgi:hypothetical protein
MEPAEFKSQIESETDTRTVVQGQPSSVDVWVEDEHEFLELIDSRAPETIFVNEIEVSEDADEDSIVVGAAFRTDQTFVGIESTPENVEQHEQREEKRKKDLFHRLRGLEDFVPHVPSQERLDRYSVDDLQEKVTKAEERKELVSKLAAEGIEISDPSRQTIRELERMLGNSGDISAAQAREKEIAEEVANSARYNLGISNRAVNLLIEEIAPEVSENPHIDKSTIAELARAYRNIRVRPQQMEDAKELLEEGKSQKEVSEILGVSKSLVREAEKRRDIW